MSARFTFADLEPRERYKMLCATVVPRPVAWITSVDEAGVVNAAPYSFFNVFSEDPALVIIGADRKPDGAVKDTVANIERAGAFTVNMADQDLLSAMVDTAAGFPAGTSEPAAIGLMLEPGGNGIPRIADAPVSLECRLFELRAVGARRHLVIGEVSAIVAREGLFDPDTKRVNFELYDPVARLYATRYARLGEPFDRPIPDWRTLVTDPLATDPVEAK